MKWLPAQDELLLQMQRRGFPTAQLATRFGVTESQIDERLQQLRAAFVAAPESPPPDTQHLPTPEEVEAVKQAMDPLQRAFMDACVAYNEMGEKFKLFSELVSSSLAPEELEQVIEKCLRSPRAPGESVAMKLARTLHQSCIVVMRPTQPTNTKQG